MGASMWGAYPNSCRICAVSILENAFNHIIFLAAAIGVAIELGSRSPAHQGGGLHFELMQRQNIEAINHTGDKRCRLCFDLNWFAVAILKLS